MRLLALTAALTLAAAPAFAADRKVDIINNTGLTMTHFYASNTGANDWQEDILGRSTLANGETSTIDINDGSGACRFDFKAVFESGASSEKGNIDVCTISTFTYTQ